MNATYNDAAWLEENGLQEYRVTWTIDVAAMDPDDAASQARIELERTDPWTTTFVVTNSVTGETITVVGPAEMQT